MTLTAGSGAVGSAALRRHDDGGGALTGRSAAVRAEWHELFVAEYPRLAGWARRLVQDDEIAHEIASESFTRLMARWERSDNPHAYLYKVAVNLVHDHWRRTRRERRLLGAVVAGRRDEAARPASGATDLRALLEPLPERQRTAVVLHHLAGFPVREVALMTGRPEGTVKSDLYQARLRLRAALEAPDD
jgi:RNA polymerase sigma-70 factor, ECF subfamily